MAHSDPFAADHTTAAVFVFLASHDREGGSMFVTPKTGAVWFMADRTGKVLTGGANQAPIEGYHQSAAVPMLREAMAQLPAGCHAHVVTHMGNVAYVLNLGRETRIARKYKASGGKKPFSSADEWRALDAVLAERGLTASGGAPASDEARFALDRAATAASFVARNIGLPYGQWEA